MAEDEGYPQDEDRRVEYWNRQVEWAKEYYEPYFKCGDTLLKIFNNVASNFREKAADDLLPDNIARIKAGVVYAWIEQSISNLQERRPFFKVSAENRTSIEGVPVVQSSINYWHRETQQAYHDDRCLLDAFVYPWMVKKLGWNSRLLDETELSLASIAQYSEEDAESAALLMASGIPLRAEEYHDHEAHIEAATAVLQDPTVPQEFKDSIVEPYIQDHQAMIDRPQADANVTIQYDAPYGVRWHPRRFLMSPFNEHGLLDAPWIGFYWCKPLHEVKNDPQFQNTDDLKATDRPEFAPENRPDLMGYDDFGLVEGWELWVRNFPVARGRRQNLRIVIAKGHDKFLKYDEQWPFTYIEDYPAVVSTFQHDVDAWINRPILALAGGDNLQMLANEMLDSLLSVVRKEKNIIFYDKDMFGEDVDFESVLHAPDMSAFPVEGLSDARGNIVVPLQFGQISNDKTQVVNIITNLFDRVMGTAEPLRARSSDTATQAAIVERRITARENRRADIFQEFQINTMRKFWQLHQQFLPERQFLVDPRADYWASVDEEIAKGEYRFKIDVSTAAASQALEFDRYQKALNLSAGLSSIMLQLYGVAPNIMKMFEDLLVKGLDIRDVENYLPKSPDQADRALQETLSDPAKRTALLEGLLRLKGGGDMIGGAGPGPVNPQLYASQPQDEADALTQANQ